MENSEFVDKWRAEIETLSCKISALEQQLEDSRRAEAAAKDEVVRLRFRSETLDVQLDNCLRLEESAKAVFYDQMITTFARLEARIQSEHPDLGRKLAECEAACRARDAQILAIYTSMSWQITKPLRFIRRLVFKLSGFKG